MPRLFSREQVRSLDNPQKRTYNESKMAGYRLRQTGISGKERGTNMKFRRKFAGVLLLLMLAESVSLIPAGAEDVATDPTETLPETAPTEEALWETEYIPETVPEETIPEDTEPEEALPYAPRVLAAGEFHTVWVTEEGTVAGFGEPSAVDGIDAWKNIVKVAGWKNTLGLKADGTVVGNGFRGGNPVSGWSDIVDMDAGEHNIAGVTAYGTVVACPLDNEGNLYHQCDISEWENVVQVAVGERNIYGLRGNGTVLVSGKERVPQGNLSMWRDITAISAGNHHVVGLKADGTVVARGVPEYCQVSNWDNIVAVAAGSQHTVGLRANGTVVATGSNQCGQCNVGGWTDIVAIDAGRYHTVGLRADGTIVTTGSDGYGQCGMEG